MMIFALLSSQTINIQRNYIIRIKLQEKNSHIHINIHLLLQINIGEYFLPNAIFHVLHISSRQRMKKCFSYSLSEYLIINA